MENFDEFMELFKNQLVARGLTKIENPQNMAESMATVMESKVTCSQNCVPIFGDGDSSVNPENIDDEYVTLDVNLGSCYF